MPATAEAIITFLGQLSQAVPQTSTSQDEAGRLAREDCDEGSAAVGVLCVHRHRASTARSAQALYLITAGNSVPWG